MPDYTFFKKTFDDLATDGFIGDPQGAPAYAYIRVSDSEQAEGGRSGLPRQIEHIHEAALNSNYRISWDLVFADDYTGFEFEGRPALSRLRTEYKSGNKRATAVIIEHLDRLSRNADWHQGFLIDEMQRAGLAVVFWKSFSSRIERAVMGAIAQDGMEHAKRRMMEGNLHKARSGRVTARVAAYGYRLVDANGNEGPEAKTDTHYGIYDPEAKVIREVFRRVCEGHTLRGIAHELERSGVAPPKQYKHWNSTQIRLFIKNEVYKGDFYAHRWEHITVKKPSKDGLSVRKVKTKRERPREEWIHVAVPPLVSAEVWDQANRMLEKNQKTGRRNAKVPYLLTGLVQCAHCGLNYVGTTKRKRKDGTLRKNPYRGYRCPFTGIRPNYMRENIECKNSHIKCEVLDGIVWEIVCKALLEPDLLISALESDEITQRNKHLLEQVAFLEREVESRSDGDDKLLRAYLAGAFDEHEYASQRQMLKNETQRLEEQLLTLRAQVINPDELKQRKELVYAMSRQLEAQGIMIDPPFDLKQRIIKMVVDEIVLDVGGGWLRLTGAIRGGFPIVNTHKDKDSRPLPA